MNNSKKSSTLDILQSSTWIKRCIPPIALGSTDVTGKITRARKYVSKIDCAVAGEQGHNRTFHVACILTGKFDLSFDDALALMFEFNDRCNPPWSSAELNHKLTDAMALVGKPAPTRLRNHGNGLINEQKTSRSSRPKLFNELRFNMTDIAALSVLRRIPPFGIKLAVDRGFFIKTIWHGHACFGIRDKSGNAIELRRFDGELFPASHGLARRKSHAIRGSNKSWPLGIIESADYPAIALVEGIPDFLYAHFRVCKEKALNRVAVIAMLSAMPLIDESALKYFKNKPVRIFPHLDAAGLHGAKRWHDQLVQAGAAQVDFFDLSGLTQHDGSPVKDLCDITAMQPDDIKSNQSLKKMLP